MHEWFGAQPDWKTLDALLRDQGIEGREFCDRAHYEDVLALASEYRTALEKIADQTASLSARRIAKAALAVRPPSESADDDGFWKPKLGDTVWLNYPDSPRPEGTVVGFVEQEGHPRLGQPIIRRPDPEEGEGAYTGPFRRTAREVIIHPQFLLPFAWGSEEYQRAVDEGRVLDPKVGR